MERHPGRSWIVTSSLALFQRILHMIRCTVSATWNRTQLYRTRLSAADPRDVTCPTSSGSDIVPTSGESCKRSSKELTVYSGSCNAASEDMSLSNLSMTRNVCRDDDVTSYSLLSASDVSQLLPVGSMDDEDEKEYRLNEEVREIWRDLADIEACAQVVGARCHDDRWRRGGALTLGVTEALTPHQSQTTRTAERLWLDASTLVDWTLDESPPKYHSRDSYRDVIVSDCSDRKLSLTCAAAELMTSSPAEDSIADIFIDDELDDVIV